MTTSYSLSAQQVSYTPPTGVIESSMFITSKNGQEAPFFITANLTEDITVFIELVFSNQVLLTEQVANLKAGLFKSALQSMDSNRFQYIYIRHLAETADLAREINNSYFSRFQQNPQDSLRRDCKLFSQKVPLDPNYYQPLTGEHYNYHLSSGQGVKNVPTIQINNHGTIIKYRFPGYR